MEENEELKEAESFILCNTTRATNESLQEIIDKFKQRKMNEEDKKNIQKFVKRRLMERYITPFPEDYETNNKSSQYGFLIMASMCLLIETIQAFKEGKDKYDGECKKAFENFLTQQKTFNCPKDLANDFYENVRCGILHQGEIGNYWKIASSVKEAPITKEGKIKIISAPTFLKTMESALNKYVESLDDKGLFDNCMKKIGFIVQNCTKKLK